MDQGGAPLLGAAEAVPSSLPSAPPPPAPARLITDVELNALTESLRAAHAQGFPAQLMELRTHLFGKVVHHQHAAQILRSLEPNNRHQALRELYELQFIVESKAAGSSFTEALSSQEALGLQQDEAFAIRQQVEATAQQALMFLPEGAAVPDGFEPSAVPSAPPADFTVPKASAPPMAAEEHTAVVLIRFDGKVVTVIGSPSTLNLAAVLEAGATNLGVSTFDPRQHYAAMVWPGHIIVADMTTPLASLGVPSWARILWLERPDVQKKGEAKAADPMNAGLRFQNVRCMFFAMSESGQTKISKAELRNFLWNLNLEDEQFASLWQRLDTRAHGFLDIDDLLHLVGRAHLQHPAVPIDALIYEAALLILRPGLQPPPQGHFDNDISGTPEGIGWQGACARHGCSYFVSILLQVVIPVFLVLFLLDVDSDNQQMHAWIAGIAYIVYLVHSFCCTRFASAVGNRIKGLNAVCNIMEAPKSEHPHFRWHVQCYHYETRTRTESYRDSNGNTQTRTVTETVRVNTWSATHRGVIPSTDHTPPFVPNTRALMTEIDSPIPLIRQ
eukprot:TRINITY_DN15395_c0_g2_i3.p1 TRINITY_DN15395_c0_g2~~TRINITY_DN15395_c0_g2_i3.p1  ORF type:complete len:558 (-),score=83.53 TRINITY_DN15395_c0_g2_i3:465-2138(-)